MATAQLLPIYTKISQKILRKRSAQRLNARSNPLISGNQYLVEGLDRFWLALRCPSHAWSWPRANHQEASEGLIRTRRATSAYRVGCSIPRDGQPGRSIGM